MFGGADKMIKEGDEAPDFEVRDAEGNNVKLSDLRGRKVVLYFYPKDDTPGCTKEACSFRDSFAEFGRRGIKVLGVSLDDETSHRKFADKYGLPFTLLADTDHAVADAYGVYGEKQFMGKKYLGVNRVTFLLDEQGRVKKVFDKVNVEQHADEVLKAFD
jgi:peroxiredoxin Q/BCP